MKLDPCTQLTLAVIDFKDGAPEKRAEACARLRAAGEAYLADPDQPERRYTKQLAHAAKNCSAVRPHDFALAVVSLQEIYDQARAEQSEERDAARRAGKLSPHRHDVRAGLIGGGD